MYLQHKTVQKEVKNEEVWNGIQETVNALLLSKQAG